MKENKERTLYFDCLRLLATYAVVVLHMAASNWYDSDVTTVQWQMMNLYDSLVRWSVPVFVMISGALFLGRDITLKSLLQKNILRVAIAFVFWSLTYALIQGGGRNTVIDNIISGHYHLWFIPMIIGLYLCVPLLRKIVADEKLMQYFLLLAVVFNYAIPQLLQLVRDFAPHILVAVADAAEEPLQDMNFHFALGYSGYFVAGYALSKVELSLRSKKWLYVAAVAGGVVTIGLDALLSLRSGEPTGTYYGNCTMNVMAMSLGLFVWVKERMAKKTVTQRVERFVALLSKYSFGAYLIHALVIDLLEQHLGLHSLTFHPALSIPLISLLVFVISMAASALLHRIPVVNKYIV
ncbi:MAG: acyltransferase family protein [Oscillospiraceae bacterium]|nr:acyltransferase family protein [Oscillospiraceae bacterium]